ncbi:T9SS type A sorting domain-containing protein [Emticicia sp. BO119]|uniref:T9SS type A sorting domain-containing protein n=1 Tax=Emticicia sp. BO119 TaxID=2757768 RepID=UPI0015F02FC3|nr:T9SS type A sorting domain-containing protein [Emticicia sp. BO119]MBA4850814.1 T9SS type A sorting domain-containing protein [Emticicia sp. BO119]
MKRIYPLILLLTLFTNFPLFAQKQDFSCGVNDNNLSEKTLQAMRMAPVWLAEKKTRKATNDLYLCRIGIDIDSDTYNYFDKDSARIKYEVTKTIERVSKIYEAEINTQLVVTHINIRKDQKTDPYYGINDIFALIDKAINIWVQAPFKNLPIDKVMYLPTKFFYGAGGVAGGNVNVSPWGNVSVIAHELGHNFGSPHTQSCNWPGGAIDFCYPVEGPCYENSIDYIRGTIMSYCQKELTFHPLCQALMQNHAETELKKIGKIEKAPVLADTIRHDGNPFILFNPSLSAENYYYEMAETADFSQIVLADSSYINAVLLQQFKKNTTYYLRIKAQNRLGTSSWSNTAVVIIPNTILLPPVLKTPENGIIENNNIFIDYPNQTHNLSFDLDTDAAQYELKLYFEYDDYKLTELAYSTINSRDQNFSFRPSGVVGAATFFWRVRAINANTTGAWSELQTVNFIEKDNTIVFPVYNLNNDSDMPINFPLFYWGNGESYDVKFTISANSDFSNPITVKLVKPTKYSREPTLDYSIMSGKLAPDTEYFLKVETIFPTGSVFRTIIKKFRTESSDIGSQYKILKHDITPNLGRVLTKLVSTDKGVFVLSSEGISRVDGNKLTAEAFTRDNTNGAIGNSAGIMNTDSLGNLWVITRLSKRTGGYDGAFPKPVYALRKFDRSTMALLSSQEFLLGDGMRYYNYIDPDNQLVITDAQITKIENGVLKSQINFGDQFNITSFANSKSYLWIAGYNYQRSRVELKRYNILTKEAEDKTPDSKYDVQSMVVDKSGSLWVTFNTGQGIARYDGVNWITYNLSNSPLDGYGFSISADNFNNVYIASQSPKRLFQFNNENWKELEGYSKININNIIVDKSGKIWSILTSNGLIRFDPCRQIIKPTIVSSATVTSEKPIILEAKGCSSVIWNWKSKEEEVHEKLVSGTSKIEVMPKTATTYRARCYDNGCSGEEDSFTISSYNIIAGKVTKNEICQGDFVVISPAIEGTFDTKNQFSAILTSSQKHFKIDLEKVREGFRFETDINLPPGKYWLRMAASSPEIISKDSIEIAILSLPAVSIVGKNNICSGEGTSIFAAAKNGKAPYIYNWIRGNFSSSGPDSVMFGIEEPTVFSVQVKDSKGCISNTTNHVITKTTFDNFKLSISGSTDLIDNTTVMFSVPLVATYTYQWYKDSQPIQGATNNTFTAKQAGKYHVQAYEKGCEAQSDVVTVSAITANEPNETNDLNLKVFPNPSDGNFGFEFTLTDNKPIELSIFDISGKRIWLKNTKGRGKYEEQINLSEYPTGTYLLVLQKAELKKTIKLEKQ